MLRIFISNELCLLPNCRAGWKKALDGSWIRDEDAEFDSDEEPPDIP